MNKFTNFLTALISGTTCTENEVQEGFAAIKAAGVACMYSNTQADGSFRCGRNKGRDYWNKPYLKSTGFILTPSYQVAINSDSKDAGEMGPFCIGRMEDKEVFQTVARGRYDVELAPVFLALAGVVIADSEIYSQDAIPAIIARINVQKVEIVSQQIQQQNVDAEPVCVVDADADAEELKAARKAAKQAEKAAQIAARKGR